MPLYSAIFPVKALTKAVLEVMRVVVISDNEKFREWLRKIFKEIRDFPEEKFERFIDASIRYILSVREDVSIEIIEKEGKEILSGRSEAIMSVAEKLRNEGRLEGQQEERKKFAYSPHEGFGGKLGE